MTEIGIQCGNFNWNKIHNLDIVIFVKNPETGRFLFFFALIYFEFTVKRERTISTVFNSRPLRVKEPIISTIQERYLF
jgi:hypothetical protein